MAVSLHQLLKTMTEMGGTDLHVTTNTAAQIRVDGKLRPLDLPPLNAVETKQLAYSVLTDAQKHRFEETLELDFSFGIKGMARFRANVFMQRGAVAACYRTIPYEIKRKALEEGMLTLRESGLEKIKAGTTTIEEVLRETVL